MKIRNSVYLTSLKLALFTIALSQCKYTSDPVTHENNYSGIISGVVCNAESSISGAIVRIQATDNYTITSDLGSFQLNNIDKNKSNIITATAPGYYIGGGIEYAAGETDIEIVLEPYSKKDNKEYEWLSAFSSSGEEGNCENCHSESGNSNSGLPFDEWINDAHSKSAKNSFFLTMYLGQDIYGNQSPPTRYVHNQDYGRFPLPPDPSKPYYGPGYKLDFPSISGNCAACHTPMAAIDNPYSIDPTNISSIESEGINCDFCHKILDVKLNSYSGLPNDNMPGVLSFEFRRPPRGHQLFTGQFDDVAPGEDVYAPVFNQSKFCAPCHMASFWGTKIYNSYGEWLESPYSSTNGKTCQDCHMPVGFTDHFARFDEGGLQRSPAKIYSHRMPGALDEDLLRNSVTMSVSINQKDNNIVVETEIFNNNTGHHIPTDSPLRHMILLIDIRDEEGNILNQTAGPTLPDWCGVGNRGDGYYAGLPGKVYAKILEELWTGVSPTGAYWNMTRIVSDNRIKAFERSNTKFTFEAPGNSKVLLRVELIYRRAFIIFKEWKGWNFSDIIMDEQIYSIGL